jgi:hypothetical protein
VVTTRSGVDPLAAADSPLARADAALPAIVEARASAIVDPWTLAASVAVGLVAISIARATLLPDVGLWDTAEAQTVPPLLGTMHPTGYPAYAILGFLATIALGPLGSPAFVMNLLSAVLFGIAAGSTVVLARLLTTNLPIAIAAGVGVVLTPIVWRLGVQADVHALHLALMATMLAALVGWERTRRRGGAVARANADRWLLAAAILGGVALANHRLTLLFAPGIAVYVLAAPPASRPPSASPRSCTSSCRSVPVSCRRPSCTATPRRSPASGTSSSAASSAVR